MKNRKILTFLLVVCLLGLAITASAQPTGGGPGAPVPFGFLEVLMGAGLLYGGYKKMHDQK